MTATQINESDAVPHRRCLTFSRNGGSLVSHKLRATAHRGQQSVSWDFALTVCDVIDRCFSGYGASFTNEDLRRKINLPGDPPYRNKDAINTVLSLLRCCGHIEGRPYRLTNPTVPLTPLIRHVWLALPRVS